MRNVIINGQTRKREQISRPRLNFPLEKRGLILSDSIVLSQDKLYNTKSLVAHLSRLQKTVARLGNKLKEMSTKLQRLSILNTKRRKMRMAWKSRKESHSATLHGLKEAQTSGGESDVPMDEN